MGTTDTPEVHWSHRRALDAIARKGHARLDAELWDALSRDMRRVHVCSYISPSGVSCHNLTPCPVHSRPRNASWSKDRDRKAQHEFRMAVLARDGYKCTRCPHRDVSGKTLVAHHVRPGYDVSAGITLCTSCHRAVDSSAR